MPSDDADLKIGDKIDDRHTDELIIDQVAAFEIAEFRTSVSLENQPRQHQIDQDNDPVAAPEERCDDHICIKQFPDHTEPECQHSEQHGPERCREQMPVFPVIHKSCSLPAEEIRRRTFVHLQACRKASVSAAAANMQPIRPDPRCVLSVFAGSCQFAAPM